MIENIKDWIITILIGAFIVNIVDMLLPSSKLKPYINIVVNFIFIFIVLTPIIGLFSSDMSFEDSILKYLGKYNKEYVDSVNQLASKTGNNSLSKGYEEGLKSVLELKLDEYGYELEAIEFDGSDIENLKIKEKSSNKKQNEDIQSNKNENVKEAFNEEKSHEVQLSDEKLKEDLIQILDVSIEDIQID